MNEMCQLYKIFLYRKMKDLFRCLDIFLFLLKTSSSISLFCFCFEISFEMFIQGLRKLFCPAFRLSKVVRPLNTFTLQDYYLPFQPRVCDFYLNYIREDNKTRAATESFFEFFYFYFLREVFDQRPECCFQVEKKK